MPPYSATRKRNERYEDEITPRTKRRVDNFDTPTGLFSPATGASLSFLVMSLDERANGQSQAVNVSDEEMSIEKKQNNLLDLLPDDMLSECFFSGYVDQKDMLTNVCSVNKRFRRVAQESVLSLDLQNKTIRPTTIENIASRFNNISKLDFSNSIHFTGACLMKLVPLSSTLRSLNLSGTILMDGDVINYLMAVECYLGGDSPLEEINLDGRQSEALRLGITDFSVAKIAKTCPNLKKLGLAWCTRISDKSVQVMKEDLDKLCDLDLSLTGVTDESCNLLSSMDSLVRLNLDATDTTDAGIQTIVRGNKSIQKLSIRFIGDLTMTTLKLLAQRDEKLSAILEMSKCADVPGVMADSILSQLTKRGTVMDSTKTNEMQLN